MSATIRVSSISGELSLERSTVGYLLKHGTEGSAQGDFGAGETAPWSEARVSAELSGAVITGEESQWGSKADAGNVVLMRCWWR